MADAPRILIVDDDPGLRFGTARLLRAAGYEVLEAATGAEGLQMALAMRPALVLLDVVLPDRSGVEICQQLKAQPACAGMLVVLVSGLNTASAQQVEGLESGADDYLVRPLPNRELVARVRAFLRAWQAEAALRASEERYRAVVATAVDGIITMNERGIIATCNAAAERLFGYAAAELVGQNVRILMPSPYREAHDGYLARYLRTGEPHIIGSGREVHGQRRDGTVFPLALAVSEVRLGEECLFTGLVRDLTAARQAAEALRQSEARYRFLAEAVPGILWMAHADGTVTYVNRHWQAYTGQALEQATGVGWTTVLHPDDLQQSLGAWRQAAEAGAPYEGEGRFRRHDGVYRWFLVRALPIRDGPGRTARWLGISIDIDAQKQAEALLQEARDELEVRVRERTAALQEANADILRFATIVSHDLRAPLVNLKGFSSELREACTVLTQALPPALAHIDAGQQAALTQALVQDIPEALGFIDASVTRMDRLIQAVLQLARLGRQELHYESVATADLVQETLQTLAHQFAQRQVQVSVGPLPVVQADRTALAQIFGNLLANAVAYLEPGRPGIITLTADVRPEATVFHVQDTGRGIAAADIPRVFDVFQRVGRQDVPGEGMGLTYVRRLVRRHGGEITCQSALGVGSTFTFTIAHDLPHDGTEGSTSSPAPCA